LTRKFGRLLARDKRDAKYLLPPPRKKPRNRKSYRYWHANGWWGDQKLSPYCVGFAWAHWLEDGPVTHRGKPPIEKPISIYNDAQMVDEWEGEDYEGTSVRAGAKVLKKRGYIEQYRWANDIDDVIYTLLYRGPMVVGTWWYEHMSHPDAQTIMDVSGFNMGGHAYLLNGINTKTDLLRVKNSWGRDWGNAGHAYIAIDDFAELLADEGEACLAIEMHSDCCD